MSTTLNFNTIKKEYLTVVLPDEKKTTIMVCTPSKSLIGELGQIGTTLSEISTAGENTDQVLDILYDFVARVMSRNKGGVKIDKELLENCLDFQDIVQFLNAYLAFVNNIKSAKN